MINPSKLWMFLQIWKAQGEKCFYCQDPKREDITMDHFVPRALFTGLISGGSMGWHLERSNIVLACHRCNVAKADRAPTSREMRRYREVFDKTPPTIQWALEWKMDDAQRAVN